MGGEPLLDGAGARQRPVELGGSRRHSADGEHQRRDAGDDGNGGQRRLTDRDRGHCDGAGERDQPKETSAALTAVLCRKRQRVDLGRARGRPAVGGQRIGPSRERRLLALDLGQPLRVEHPLAGAAVALGLEVAQAVAQRADVGEGAKSACSASRATTTAAARAA